jgi:uncharacterized protein YjbI with pentapeptide repeats
MKNLSGLLRKFTVGVGMDKTVGQDMNQQLTIEGQYISNASYAGMQLSRFVSIASNFEDCNFSNMKVNLATFGGGTNMSVYKGCTFDGSYIRAIAPGNARFENCSFTNIHFPELNCRKVEFVNCFFSGSIDKGYFTGSVKTPIPNSPDNINEFHGNDFRGVDLIDVDFRCGIDLRLQKLPTGKQYILLKQENF